MDKMTNQTLLEDPTLCTVDTCPMEMASMLYIPMLWGNLLYIGVFGICALGQAGLGIYYKTWTYMAAMLSGIGLEIIGYFARVQMHNDIFAEDPFLMYLVCLTIGPAFLSGAIYLCLSRIVIAYGENIPMFRARTYTIVFITCDFIALLLQAAGGAIASSAETKDLTDLGINIMIAGVSWQVFSLVVFAILCGQFAWKVRKAQPFDFNLQFSGLRQTKPFVMFLWSLAAASLLIIIRSVFRCAELQEGFDGPMANDETSFMILEGAMICASVIALTVFHPGWTWKGQWGDAVWNLRKKGEKPGVYKTVDGESSIALHSKNGSDFES